MGTRPPYLFGTGVDDSRDSHLELTGDVDTAVIEMTVHGRWGRRLCLDVAAAARKCFAERPSAVIVDVRDLDDADGASMPLWVSERRAAAALLPAVRLALCVAPATTLAQRLRKVGAHLLLPMFATMTEARVVVNRQLPMTDMSQLRLPPELTVVDEALQLVSDSCKAWDLGHLRRPGRVIMTELVCNVVEHARTNMLVTVSRRGTGLHLSVHDGDPRLPRLLSSAPVRGAEPGPDRSHGLQIVHAEAIAWGAMPTRVGKVVWATVRDHGWGRPIR